MSAAPLKPETHPLTWRLAHGAPVNDIADYEALQGYASVRKALRELEPAALTQLVKDSNLRGRGGAGFPTGVKWSLVPMGPDVGTKYLICNADEMEPGTFKDRLLMEQIPHFLVESMILSAWAIQATRGYIFLRGEYVLAAERTARALAQAREKGYLGKNILGTGWDFDLFLHTGAGRYICGEETALIN
ncbi:MAG: NADH-quinone oxidoreductase subunit F, partial [Gammaproteobacteria bacterium]